MNYIVTPGRLVGIFELHLDLNWRHANSVEPLGRTVQILVRKISKAMSPR
jgi:hypothetical protein